MKTNDQPEPSMFVTFGGAGGLTWRKLVPALGAFAKCTMHRQHSCELQ
jgi:glucose-6-phosphate 1-dehydrogenase